MSQTKSAKATRRRAPKVPPPGKPAAPPPPVEPRISINPTVDGRARIDVSLIMDMPSAMAFQTLLQGVVNGLMQQRTRAPAPAASATKTKRAKAAKTAKGK